MFDQVHVEYIFAKQVALGSALGNEERHIIISAEIAFAVIDELIYKLHTVVKTQWMRKAMAYLIYMARIVKFILCLIIIAV